MRKFIPQFILVWFIIFAISTACRTNDPQPTPLPISSEIDTNTIKLDVMEDGIYQVTQQQLIEAGFAIDALSADDLSLTHQATAVPYLLTDNSLIFYGQAPNGRYTPTRTYLLQSGQSGQLMTTTAVDTSAAPILDHINRTLHLEENHIYEPTARTPIDNQTDVWYWAKLGQKQKLPLEFDLTAVSDGSGILTLNLLGLTQNMDVDNDHDFDLLLNGQNLGTIRWDGETSHTATLDIPAGTLQSGTNELILNNESEGASFLDIMQLNWLQLDYAAPVSLSNDEQITFNTTVGTFNLTTPNNNTPIILDITDAANPRQVTGWMPDSNLSFPTDSLITIANPNALLSPTLSAYRQSDWHNSNHQADLLIITTDELIPALDPLVEARQAQGLTVAIIPVGDIYDEFGDGESTPDSIQAFVAHAYENWQTPQPRYLFLVGDATTDYHDYLGLMPRNHIPSTIVPVQYGGETVSDSRLADVDGDSKPDLAVGRWPVDSVAQVEDLVKRTLAYESATAVGNTLFATDSTEPQFISIAQRLTEQSGLPADTNTILNGPQASEITSQWNDGTWLSTYIGHGSVQRWGKEDVFFPEAVADLDASTPPIVLQLTCLTGLFAHPEIESLSETMLYDKNGPVLLVAATSLTLSSHQEPFALDLLKALQNPVNTRIGDAFQIAKQNLAIENNNALREISDTFALIGDPSTQITRPMGNEQ